MGVCVDEAWVDGFNTTFTSTYTGILIPFYTLTVTASNAGKSSPAAMEAAIFATFFAVMILRSL
jgi:hypothetical protein